MLYCSFFERAEMSVLLLLASYVMVQAAPTFGKFEKELNDQRVLELSEVPLEVAKFKEEKHRLSVGGLPPEDEESPQKVESIEVHLESHDHKNHLTQEEQNLRDHEEVNHTPRGEHTITREPEEDVESKGDIISYGKWWTAVENQSWYGLQLCCLKGIQAGQAGNEHGTYSQNVAEEILRKMDNEEVEGCENTFDQCRETFVMENRMRSEDLACPIEDYFMVEGTKLVFKTEFNTTTCRD